MLKRMGGLIAKAKTSKPGIHIKKREFDKREKKKGKK